MGSLEYCTYLKFVAAILKLNPKCDFDLIVIDDKSQSTSTIRMSHCLYIKLNVIPIENDWTCSYLNFEQIFLDIEMMCNPSKRFKMIFK